MFVTREFLKFQGYKEKRDGIFGDGTNWSIAIHISPHSFSHTSFPIRCRVEKTYAKLRELIQVLSPHESELKKQSLGIQNPTLKKMK